MHINVEYLNTNLILSIIKMDLKVSVEFLRELSIVRNFQDYDDIV